MSRNKNKKITKKSQKASKIKKNMTFAEITQKYPEVGEVLIKKGLHCIGCGMALYETLEQGAIMHGLNPDKLVAEINKKIGKKIK